jgi:hypothetical protein
MTISCTVSNYQISINISFKLIKNINGILINDTSLQSTEFQQIEPNTLAMNNWVNLNTELKEILLGQTTDLTYVIDTSLDPNYATTKQIAIELANSNFIFLFIEKLKELKEYMPINYGKYNSSWTTNNQYLIEQEDGSNTTTNAKVNISTSHFNQTNDIIDVLYTYEYKNQYNKIIKYLFDNSLTQENISKLNNDANASEMIKLFLFSQAHSLYSETNGILKMIELNSDELPNSIIFNNAVVGDIKLSRNKSDFNSGIDAMDYYWIEPQDEDMSDEEYKSTILDVYTNDVLNPIKIKYNQLFNSNYKFILELEVFKDRIEYQTGVKNLSIGDTVEFDLNIGVYRDIRITGYLIVSKIEEIQYTYKLSGIAKKYDNSPRGSYSSSSTTLQATLQVNL